MEKRILIGIFLIFILIVPTAVAGTSGGVGEKQALETEAVSAVESPGIEWNGTYGGEKRDRFYGVAPMDDGYLLAGQTYSYKVGYSSINAWIMRIDSEGEEVWNRTYPAGREIRSFSKTSDGYVGIGSLSVPNRKSEIWIIKFDDELNELWNSSFGGEDTDVARGFAETPDGGYMVVGSTFSYGSTVNGLIVKFDGSGNVVWNRTVDSGERDYITSIEKVKNGYILSGTSGDTTPSFDSLIMKIDEDGNEVWSKSFDRGYYNSLDNIVETDDGYVFAGQKNETYWDGWVVKTDKEGEMLWERRYGGEGYDVMYSIVKTLDGGYVIGGGISKTKESSPNAWMLKINDTGIEEWNISFGGKNTEYFYNVYADGAGYLGTGRNTLSRGDFDGIAVKTEDDEITVEEFVANYISRDSKVEFAELQKAIEWWVTEKEIEEVGQKVEFPNLQKLISLWVSGQKA